MKSFVLTKEIFTNAKTYIPLDEKIVLATVIAERSIKPIKLDKDNGILTNLICEDMATKNILIMQILIEQYLGLNFTNKEEDIFKSYDYYASGSLINQIERFKFDSELKAKAYDLLDDFKQFKAIVSTTIYNNILEVNDIGNRISKALLSILTPENIQKTVAQIKAELESIDVGNIHEAEDVDFPSLDDEGEENFGA